MNTTVNTFNLKDYDKKVFLSLETGLAFFEERGYLINKHWDVIQADNLGNPVHYGHFAYNDDHDLIFKCVK